MFLLVHPQSATIGIVSTSMFTISANLPLRFVGCNPTINEAS
jgi:hypothetical protein